MPLRQWFARAAGVVGRDRREARLDEEMRAHLDALTDAHLARGLSREEAQLAARRDFGGVDQVREQHRDQAGLPRLEAAVRDLGHAVRRLRSDGWFTSAVVAAMAIGIGGAVAVTGAVTAISMATPPFRDPGSVMAVASVDAQGRRAEVSWPDFQDWRGQTRTFTDLAAYAGASVVVAEDGVAAERVMGTHVTANTFALLGVAPAVGRDFVAADDQPGAPRVALLGADLWAWRFDSAADVVGRTITIDGAPTTVIGVMPPAITFPMRAAVWLPMAHRPGLSDLGRDRRVIAVVGRLADGARPATARDEIDRLAAVTRGTEPPAATAPAIRATVVPFAERFLGRSTDPVPLALLGAAAMVLAIGCATAATLLFARSAFRHDEMALRVALGATRSRLVSQLLAEAAAVATLAGLTGTAAAWLALQWFADRLAEAGLPPWVHFGLDRRVVALAVAASAVATIVGGLAPAWRLATGATAPPQGTRNATSVGTRRWIGAVVATQVALTLMLLAGSGHLASAAVSLMRTDAVVETTGVVTAQLTVNGPGYDNATQRAAFLARYAERVRARGDIEAVAIASAPPFGGAPLRRVALERASFADPAARVVSVDGGYFGALRLGALHGRGIAAADGSPGLAAAVVNARFAATFFPQGDAVGQRVRVAPSSTEAPAGAWLTIVGVMPSVRYGPSPDPEPVLYLPLATDAPANVFVLARGGPGSPVAAILREELQALDAGLPLYGWQPLTWYSELGRWTQRTIGLVAGVLGGLALTLSALGIFAVTAYAAARRTKEAGIRMAVGASRGDIVRLLVRGAAWPLLLGVAAGAAGATAAAGALRFMLPQTSASGPAVALSAAVVVAVVCVIAAVAPARAVASPRSLQALRTE
jgi:putative ABC transport system permease protein